MADKSSREPPQRRSHPLFWIVVLAALLTYGWSCYNRHAVEEVPAVTSPGVTAPPPPPPRPP